MSTRYVDIFATLLYETDAAYLITIDEKNEIWLPKSQCGEVDIQTKNKVEYFDGEVAEWIAKEKGLI